MKKPRIDRTYRKDVEIMRREIADLVNGIFKQRNLTNMDIGSEYYQKFGFGFPGSASGFINYMRNGKRYEHGTIYGRGVIFDKTELKRLGALFSILQIPKNHPVVKKLKKFDPEFDYEVIKQKPKRVFKYDKQGNPVKGQDFEQYLEDLKIEDRKNPLRCPELIVLLRDIQIDSPQEKTNYKKNSFICLYSVRRNLKEKRCTINSLLKFENGWFKFKCTRSGLEFITREIRLDE
jgi:hypothetical protein